ncbi:MAG: hypothetical protein KA902_02065 [Arenimonas sp.]|nr:hypothetical protein [Arenimonas sp.]
MADAMSVGGGGPRSAFVVAAVELGSVAVGASCLLVHAVSDSNIIEVSRYLFIVIPQIKVKGRA